MFDIQVSSHTDSGDKKETNQDCIFFRTDDVDGHKVGLYIVADGCGGLAYGEEISNLVVTHFSRVWNNELKILLNKKKIKDDSVNELLEKAIKDINDGAIRFGKQVGSRVGSTMSLLLAIDEKYYIKNIGDSRVYLKRKNNMRQLTEDQSLVADLIRNGELSREEAKSFKKKNVLTMCIGVFETIKTYSISGKIKNNDTFILCCDGLHNHVSNEKMIDILNSKKISFEHKAEELRNSIGNGMANDNVSAVICKFKKTRNIKKRITWLLLIIAMILLIAVLDHIFFLRRPIVELLLRIGD